MILHRDERIYAGAVLAPLTLYPAGETRGLIWLSDLTDTLIPLHAASRRGIYTAEALVLISILIGFVLLKPCPISSKNAQQDQARQDELAALQTELTVVIAERDEQAQRLTDLTTKEHQWHKTRQTLEAQVNALEASQSELKALTDTLQAELDASPSAINPSAELNQAYTTIAELKGLLEQCNHALTASHKQLHESLAINQELEQRLERAK